MSLRFRHCLSIISSPDPRSRPFSGFMAPLWILGLLSRLRLRLLFCSLVILFRRNLVSSQHHRLFLSQHLFLRFRYPVSLQPNLRFRSQPRSILPSLRSLPFNLLPPRLRSDFSVHRSSYRSSISMASLWLDCCSRFPALFVDFVDFSSLRPPSSLSTTLSYVVLH